jgi:hypothetical protein
VKRQVAAVLLLWLILTACGSSTTPVDTQVGPTQVNADGGPQSDLPSAWIVSHATQILGTLAAGGTTKGHFDPAPKLPDLAQVGLIANSQAIIMIKSSSIQEFKATVRPWKADGTIVPLEDPSAREITGQLDKSTIRIWLNLSGEDMDQILNIKITFSEGWGYYLWRIHPTKS